MERLDHFEEEAPREDFLSLPNEIINDVVAVAVEDHHEINGILENLLKLEGRWGTFAQKIIETVKSEFRVEFTGSKFCMKVRWGHYVRLTLEDARKHFICKAVIDENTNLDLLRAVASNLYGSVGFYNVPDLPNDIIARIGNRFSSFSWSLEWNREDGTPPKNYIKPEVCDLLKRQLESKYLRKLTIAAVGFKQGELDALLVKFMKRPLFERLKLNGASERGAEYGGGYTLSFQVLKETLENWHSVEQFKVESQEISGSIYQETLELLKKSKWGYNRKNCMKWTKRHPSLNGAKLKASVMKLLDPYTHLTLTLANLFSLEN